MLNCEIEEFIKTIRALKAQIGILTEIKLNKNEYKLINIALNEISSVVSDYLEDLNHEKL
ncbi:MAG: hypothetical protein ABF289_14555 [Clostridiales bacterium]